MVDGKEGGTGAAPAEFIDNIGMPLRDGLAFVNAALVGAGLRDKIKLGCAGKIITGFDMAGAFALGADWCNVARGFMFAIGCIQAQSCHTGHCPTGVTTQDPMRQRALVVPSKAERVKNFHHETIKSLAEMLAAAGMTSPTGLRPYHISRRVEVFMTFFGSGRVLRGLGELRDRILPQSFQILKRFDVSWKHQKRPQLLFSINLSDF